MRSLHAGRQTASILLLAILGSARYAAAASALNCTDDADHGLIHNTTDASYDILCGVDYLTSNLATHTVPTFEDCIAHCDAEVLCIDVSFVPSQEACYVKGYLGGPSNNSDVWTARNRVVVSDTYLSCYNNQSDGSLYNTTSGSSYEILCGVDYYGGDMFGVERNTFLECLEICDDTPGCIDVSYVEPSCYLKDSMGEPSSVDHVWTAKRVKDPDPKPSTSSSTLASTSSSSSSTTIASSSASPTRVPTTAPPNPPSPSTVLVPSPSSSKFSTLPPFANTTRSSVPTSSTSANPTPTGPTCVDDYSDGTNFTTSSGSVYEIACGYERGAGVVTTAYAASFEACMDQCDAASACADVTLVGAYCYMKSAVGDAVASPGSWSATRVQAGDAGGDMGLSCYNANTNGTVFTTRQGRAYRIMCGVDLPGGDMETVTADTFAGCLSSCDGAAGCVDVAYVAPYCYLKNVETAQVASPDVWAAVPV